MSSTILYFISYNINEVNAEKSVAALSSNFTEFISDKSIRKKW